MQVGALETVICDGHKVPEKDINFVLEMLERQLLKLDGIKAEGEGKVQRKMEVTIIKLSLFFFCFINHFYSQNCCLHFHHLTPVSKFSLSLLFPKRGSSEAAKKVTVLHCYNFHNQYSS